MIFGTEPLTALFVSLGTISLGLTVFWWLYAHNKTTAKPDAELRALRAELDQQRQDFEKQQIVVNYLRGQDMERGQQIARLQQENATLRAEVAAVRAENAQLHAINEHLGKTLDSRRTTTRRKVSAGLRAALTERLNDDELRTLCFDLGIAYDDLAGEGHGAHATALVAYAERHGRVDDLVEWLGRARPEVEL